MPSLQTRGYIGVQGDFERWATISKWKDSLSIVALTKPAGHFVTPTLKRIGPAIWN